MFSFQQYNLTVSSQFAELGVPSPGLVDCLYLLVKLSVLYNFIETIVSVMPVDISMQYVPPRV